jgi:hypothetical protein
VLQLRALNSPGTKTTANEWAAKVKATATEQDEKYDDKDDGVHCNPSRFTDERALARISHTDE